MRTQLKSVRIHVNPKFETPIKTIEQIPETMTAEFYYLTARGGLAQYRYSELTPLQVTRLGNRLEKLGYKPLPVYYWPGYIVVVYDR
jgi:hypothetical protein